MSKNINIARVIRKDVVDGDVGLELEVELTKPGKISVPYPWICKKEGSLRNYGIEYTTRSAIKIDKVDDALDSLMKVVKSQEGIDMCTRASFHVHRNITKFTPIQVWNIAVAYWFFENLLFKYCGEEQRSGNLFCLRVVDAPGIINAVYKDVKYVLPFSEFANNNDYRYAGLNMNAIHKFGSVEFRGMSCKLDAKFLSTWVKELNSMVEAAVAYDSPESIYREYYKNKKDIKVFMRKFFSEYFVNTLCSYHNWQTDITNQEGLLVGVCFLNWERWLKAQHAELDKHLTSLEEADKKARERSMRDCAAYAKEMREEGGRTEEQIQAQLRRAYPQLFPSDPKHLEYSSWMVGIKVLDEKGNVDFVVGEKKRGQGAGLVIIDDIDNDDPYVAIDEDQAPPRPARNTDEWLAVNPVPLARRHIID